MEKFKDLPQEFLLTDSSVNSYGFRLLTAGYLMDEFKKNPIGYYMHDRNDGVLVKWREFRKDGDKVFAKPSINLSHPRGQRTVDEIENGFLNAASCGHFVVLEMNNKPTSPLPNQTGPDVTKWFNREASLVDVPGNFNALKLFDADNNEINLAALNIKKFTMKQTFLTAAALGVLNLKAEATEQDAETAINDLVAKAAKVDALTNQLNAANTAKTAAEEKLAAAEKAAAEKEVNTIAEAALAAGKVTKAGADELQKQFAGNPTGLKAVVDALQAHTPITSQLSGKEKQVEGLKGKSWAELDKDGQLENLKAADASTWFEKFEDHFGKRHQDDTRK